KCVIFNSLRALGHDGNDSNLLIV
ncbi:hypothetical protein, partial [Shigella sonnei]